MTCDYCGKDIPRGTRYKNTSYVSKRFCTKECYDSYVLQQKKNHFIVLKDYIRDLYGGSENVDWLRVTKQIDSIKEKYKLTDKDIYDIIKYAIELEQHELDYDFLLGQFIPKYISPWNKFRKQMTLNQETAESLGEEIVEYEIVQINKNKRIRWVKEEDWD